MLGLYFITFTTRKGMESLWPKLRANKIWNDVALPTLPIVVGAGIAFWAKKYPFPELIASTSARVFFGAVCGGASAWGYRILKAIVKKQWGVDLSNHPEPEPGVPTPVIPMNVPPPGDLK